VAVAAAAAAVALPLAGVVSGRLATAAVLVSCGAIVLAVVGELHGRKGAVRGLSRTAAATLAALAAALIAAAHGGKTVGWAGATFLIVFAVLGGLVQLFSFFAAPPAKQE
jgi:hypothetical protein